MMQRRRTRIGLGQGLLFVAFLLALGLIAAILYENFFGAA